MFCMGFQIISYRSQLVTTAAFNWKDGKQMNSGLN